ncbi:hypothetical protein [Deinococcus sp. QL22]|uniref:hypothetical protein n=1 Tax=Deinococcus sp. QL22 TaxID=2939437 RepID=UPI002017CD88|nr:hypothetical protein [Deinococcus sp. QL22]UQN05437.1 hypothetical protein M1R55_11185 [Deinococcus sp. QL22]
MPVPTLANAEAFTAGLTNVAYKETFKPPTGNTTTTTASTRPISGAVYPRPTR